MTHEQGVAGERADHRHVDHVEPERAQPTVGEQHRLHDQDDRDAQRPCPRPDEHGRQDASEQVAAGSGRHGEVQHLDGEHERRGESAQRDLRSSSVRADMRRHNATSPMAIDAGRRSTSGASMNPSGMCIANTATDTFLPAPGVGGARIVLSCESFAMSSERRSTWPRTRNVPPHVAPMRNVRGQVQELHQR